MLKRVALLAGITAFVVPSAKASFYDPTADFSATSNPTGVWSYGSRPSNDFGGSSLNLYPDVQTYMGSIAVWSPKVDQFNPFVSKNLSNASLDDGPTTWLAGQLVLHSGVGLASVIRFTAPSDMTLRLDAIFSNQSESFSGTRVFIFQNGTQVFSDTLGGFGSTSQVSPVLLSFSAGSNLDFVVGPRVDGTANSTSTGLTASLTAVPEPSALVLLSIAGPCLLGILRTRVGGRRRCEGMKTGT